MSLWKTLFARTAANTYQAMRGDKATNTLQTISYPHHEIHAGSGFFYGYTQDMTDGHYIDIQISTPSGTKWAHMTFQVSSENECEVQLLENVTISVAGAALTERNSNRNSGTTATTTLAYITNTSLVNAESDTGTGSARNLLEFRLGSAKATGGEFSHENEIILDADEDYSLRIQAIAAGWVNYYFNWYEHTDVN